VSASGSIGELQCPLSDSQTHLSDESYHGLDESDGGGLPLVETYPCPSWTTAAPPPSSPSPAAPPSPPMASTASADDVRDATGFQPSFTHPDAAEAGRGESASHVNVELSACVRALEFEQGRTARNYCKPNPQICPSPSAHAHVSVPSRGPECATPARLPSAPMDAWRAALPSPSHRVRELAEPRTFCPRCPLVHAYRPLVRQW
jgi:hypothetical protein